MDIKGSYGTIKFSPPSDRVNDWLVIKQESISYDKDVVLLESYNKNFPYAKVNNYEELTDIVSRSSKLNEWFANESLKYGMAVQVPLYLKNKLEPSQFKEVSRKIAEINDIIANSSKIRQAEAVKYKETLDTINTDEKSQIDNIIKDDNIVEVLTLSSERLPISIQLLINRYTPKDADIDEKLAKKSFSRECLISYKTSLLELVQQKPEIKISDVIEENRLK
jgi:anion-transporting  ArsA/GET3 family ATPase